MLALLIGAEAVSAPRLAVVKDVRVFADVDKTRLVFDLSQAASERVFALDNPQRVVIDIADARIDLAAARSVSQGFIKEFHTGDQGNGVLRVVLHVTQPVDWHSFSIEPTEGLGHRLVVDLSAAGKPIAATQPSSLPKTPVKITETGRTLVVAVDAGHGGQDPGASGRKGTREKDVTLAIARKLKELIDSEPGMRAVLTRDTDVFVPLRERMVRAAKHKADIFISIHADAVRDRSVAGSSVYVLSAGRATNEASRMLADRENAADLMGGVSLEDKDDVLAFVLLDMSQGASMSASIEAADKVLLQLDRLGEVLDKEVKHASLKVLTSTGMPSMLVETAFISNLKEEAKLNDPRHQQKLADAILTGVRAYFYDNPPPGTQISERVAQQRKHEGSGGVTMLAGGVAQ
jgi:N-acetylmuramoyl-L-alanine amidase